MPEDQHYLVGVDIGGTFTDFVFYDVRARTLTLHKVLTTPDEPSRAVIEGLRKLLSDANTDGNSIDLAIHGTTLITNALIERKGAKTALVTTEGHRDVLEMGTELRYDSYDLAMEKPEPLVPRQLRFGVAERLDNHGCVVRPLDEESVERVANALADQGVQSVAICFLHSFRNPDHEQRVAQALEAALPNLTISISSVIAPEIREYQRMSTTVANAYVKPLTASYLRRLSDELGQLGYRHDLHLMLSSGGITNTEIANDHPIQLLESGPAGGALWAGYVGKLTERDELVSFDMGGTTAKMAYVAGGKPLIARSFEVARVSRFRMGSGLPVQVPVIEMIEIGAGGGSIAFKDALGLLKVGPASAGADPGPACYGFGGTSPTVTDADLVLGYLSEDSFLGGDMRLSKERAEAAIRQHVAEPLGLDLEVAARGIFDVVNENMISATKVHVAEKGRDPRRAALVAFGGAGPIHAHAIATALQMREVICPLKAGVASALGFLTAPIAFDFARSVASILNQLRGETLSETVQSMEERGRNTLGAAGISVADIQHVRSADMRYVGQGHEIEVELPSGPIDDAYVSKLAGAFHDQYRAVYGKSHPDVPVELITCRVQSSGPDPALTVPRMEPAPPVSTDAAKTGSRLVSFGNGGFVDTNVYDRYALGAGSEVQGPAIVEERESTVAIPPEMRAQVDAYGNLILVHTGMEAA